MWAYACSLPPKEYGEWIEDGSTMTEVKIGLGPPLVDKFIKSPGPWASFLLFASVHVSFFIFCILIFQNRCL